MSAGPFLFHRHLRKQQALAVAVLHQQSVLADPDLLKIVTRRSGESTEIHRRGRATPPQLPAGSEDRAARVRGRVAHGQVRGLIGAV